MKVQSAAIKIFSMLLSLTPSLAQPAQPAQPTPQQTAKQATNPVPVHSVVFLAPTNSRISFVGIHVGDDPKPRLGGFTQFQGYAVAEPAKNSIESLVVDINVDSVWTQFEKLTGHIKNADFFDTEKFPAAQFVSTEIAVTEAGKCSITGNLTLHGVTKAFSFPASYRFENGGLLLGAKFQLDRSQFGMDQMLSGVDKLVEVEIVVGQATSPSQAEPGHGGGGKKKQSSVEPENRLQQVSIELPNMT